MHKTFTHHGAQYSVKVSGRIAHIHAFGKTAEWVWDDYVPYDSVEAMTDREWAVLAIEILADSGLIKWMDGEWHRTEDLHEVGQEMRWAAEHLRQESRTDLFV